MRKQIITVLFTLFALSMQGQEAKFRLEGNLGQKDYTGAVHIIDLLTKDTVATAPVVRGELQPVEGKFETIRMCGIAASDRRFMLYPLYIDKGTTCIDGCDEDGELRQSGTPVSDEINHFKAALRQSPDAEGLISDMITRHADDVLGVNILTGMAEVSLSPDRWLELLGKIDAKFYGYPKLANSLNKTRAKMEVRAQTWTGRKFADFAVEYKGKTTRLSDYVGRGQYVLVDFWASWCGPCRQQMPELVALHQQYKDSGFTVLGIAVRENAEQTEKTIRDLEIPYPQIIDAQDIPVTLYGLDTIPHTILFSPDGTIVARDLYGDRLKAKLREIFSDD